MQENNKEVNNNQNEKENKQKGNFFKEHKAEFRKITWPTKKVLVNQTITVIFISLIVGAIIYGYDFVINFFIQKLITL